MTKEGECIGVPTGIEAIGEYSISRVKARAAGDARDYVLLFDELVLRQREAWIDCRRREAEFGNERPESGTAVPILWREGRWKHHFKNFATIIN